MSKSRKAISASSRALVMAAAIFAVYIVFIMGIIQGYVQQYLGGFTSGLGAIGSAIIVFVAVLPGVYVVKRFAFKKA